MRKLKLSKLNAAGHRLLIPDSQWQPLGDRDIDPSHPYGSQDFEYACTPILSRLPSIFEAYRSGGTIAEVDEEVSRWVTGFWDEFSCNLKRELDLYYYKYLNPETCDPENLDWIASVLGFQEDMFSPLWTDAQKRAILNNSHSLLFPFIGSAKVVNFLLKVLEVPTYKGCGEHDTGDLFYRHPYFKLGISRIPSHLGRDPFKFYVRIPLTSIEPVEPKRNGIEFSNAELIVDNYTLAQTVGIVSYDYFYLGISSLGDPLFDRTQELICEGQGEYQELQSAFAPEDDCLCFLKFMLEKFELNFQIWKVVHFRLGVTKLPAPVPLPSPDFYLIAPDDEPQNSDRWSYTAQLAGRICKNETFTVCHRFFRFGISRLGRQPLFSVS